MRVEEARIAPCTWRVVVELDRAELTAAEDERLRERAANERVPGFRPGKAPLGVLRRMFGAEIATAERNRLTETGVGDALTRIGPTAFAPEVEASTEHDGGVRVSVVVHTLPEDLPTIDVADLELRWPVPRLEEGAAERIAADAAAAGGGDPGELRERVLEVLAEAVEDELAEERAASVEDALLARFGDLEVPPDLLDAIAERVPDEENRGAVRESLVIDMLFFAIARQNGLRPDPEAVFARARAAVADAPRPQRALDALYREPLRLRELEEDVLRDAVVRWVHDHARVVEAPVLLGGGLGGGAAAG